MLLEVVAEKTGYPAEMLEPDMQLDADLGIDSIKRVEILSALQERLPEAPAIKPEHLGTLRTLGQIAEFLASGTESSSSRDASRWPRPSVIEIAIDPRAEGGRIRLSVQRLVVRAVALDEGRREPVVRPGGARVWVARRRHRACLRRLASRLKGMGYRPRVVAAPPIWRDWARRRGSSG